MSEKNNGGPAFPVLRQHISGDVIGSAGGMTLRDWFAGQQMVRVASGWPNEETMSLIAANCYAMADAMLKARGEA